MFSCLLPDLVIKSERQLLRVTYKNNVHTFYCLIGKTDIFVLSIYLISLLEMNNISLDSFQYFMYSILNIILYKAHTAFNEIVQIKLF